MVQRSTTTRWQRIARLDYAGGDMMHVTPETAEDCGDGLFTFIFRELGEEGLSFDDALRRMENARAQIDQVIDGLLRRN